MTKKNNLKHGKTLTWYFLFGAGISSILLHLLRNVSQIYFLFFLLTIFGFFISSFAGKISKKTVFSGATILVASIYILLVSFFASEDESPLLGFFRLFYMLPIILYFIKSNLNDQESLFFWKIILIFSFFATLSILIQYIIGPISWFASNSERADTDRFASLVGSLTSYGGFVATPILISLFIIKKNILKIAMLTFLVLGSVLSLQKMSIASVFISFLLYAYFTKISLSSTFFIKIIYFIIFIIVIVFSIYYFSNIYFPNHLNYFSLVFTDDAGNVGDVSVNQSIVDRFVDIPLEAIRYWGFSNVFMGVGVYGGAGGLGYPHLPMAHNFLLEVILILGVPLGITILGMLFTVLVRFLIIAKKNENIRLRLAVSVFAALLLANIFSGGLLYHPVIGLAFWFSFSELMRYKTYVSIQR